MRNAHLWFVLFAVLMACGGALGRQREQQSGVLQMSSIEAPARTALRQNPYEGQAEAVTAGRKLFRRHCAVCHGFAGRGQGTAPNLHSTIVQRVSPGALFWFLKNGNLREGMPSWSRLPDERLWQLVSYLKALQ
ncbi:MAG TPA: c-type cytochrome [Candidatus Acidoferrales bacterium]|jgi:mono/diheme cytochrome c family protein|nr:c-type cytochrome [Candidatus Acidoferrales bacterium]